MKANVADVRPGPSTLTPATEPVSMTQYLSVRERSAAISAPLSAEDQQIQSMPDVSPTKWHLAHTSWFFETFLLSPLPDYEVYDSSYAVLFNSYYNAVGEQYARPRRGLLSRPSLESVWGYRQHVDERVQALFAGGKLTPKQLTIIELGLHHEQQHQELMVTDIKHVLAQNPTHPVYLPAPEVRNQGECVTKAWHSYDGGLLDIGYHGADFCFDNERPRHRSYLPPFKLASRLVTAGEWQAFMAAGGYEQAELWLSEGWDWVQREQIRAPLYWHGADNVFTLHGLRPLHADEPVVHVSYYEADAFARWAGARLPREAELEVAARSQPLQGNFAESETLHPTPAMRKKNGTIQEHSEAPAQLFGDCWEWTQSSYSPYPGYSPPDGALGEYNGKFMCNQQVLRGGSCATPRSHMRPTYRNFFPASARWQFTGVRLAHD